MHILKQKIRRRDFLRRIAGAGLTVAFTSQFISPRVFAQASGAQRFVFVYYPNGVNRGDTQWHQFPIGSLGPSSLGTSPLSELRDNANLMCAFKDLHFTGAGGSSGHDQACDTLFAGGNGGTTFDVAMGRALGGNSRDYFHLGIWSSRTESTTKMPFTDENGNKIRVPDDPQSFYEFNLSRFASTGSGSDDAEDTLRRRVLESLHENLDVLQARQLNITQEGKLMRHEQALDFYQNVLSQSASIDGIQAPNVRMSGINEEAPLVADAQVKNIGMSFQADISRVATLQILGAQDESLMINFESVRPYMGEYGSGDRLTWFETRSHPASHRETQLPTLTAQTHWYCQVVNALVEQLKARPDPVFGGNLMDRTVILVMSEMGGGNHQQENTGTFVMAGSETGINTGRGIDAGGKTSASLFWDISRVFGLGWSSYGRSDGSVPGFFG